MTVHSIVSIARIWIGAGGSPEGGVLQNVVAIALAESGGDDHAISPSSDYGLWQINRVHFGDGIINASNWSNPAVSAHESIRLSGNGTNWAAWCTAWADPGPNCGHGNISRVQPGSAAYGHVWQVQTALAAAGLMVGSVAAGPSSTSGRASAAAAWRTITSYVGHKSAQQWHAIDALQSAMFHARPR